MIKKRRILKQLLCSKPFTVSQQFIQTHITNKTNQRFQTNHVKDPPIVPIPATVSIIQAYVLVRVFCYFASPWLRLVPSSVPQAPVCDMH